MTTANVNASTSPTAGEENPRPQHQHQPQPQTQAQSQSQSQAQPLPLPAPPSADVAQLDVSTGLGVRLDHLGPMVVNRDGTLSRIANWEHMTEMERRNTLRVLGKRNQLRQEALKTEEGAK